MTRVALLLILVAACVHATKVEPAPKAATHATSKTTQLMFKTEGVKELQAKLEVTQTGVLDEPTQRALRAYQRKEKIAETGLPDYEAIRRLGIAPDGLFHHEPPAERVGVK